MRRRALSSKAPGINVTNAPCGGTLRLYPVKAPPVELNAVTGTARRDRVTVIDLQRLRNVAFKSEPMGFQVTSGGEQMHGDIMGAVARHRQVECLG